MGKPGIGRAVVLALCTGALCAIYFTGGAPSEERSLAPPSSAPAAEAPSYPPRQASAVALERLTGSADARTRRAALLELRRRGDREALLALLARLPEAAREPEPELAALLVLSTKQLDRRLGAGLAAARLAELFEQSHARHVRWAVRTAFELYPAPGDAPAKARLKGDRS